MNELETSWHSYPKIYNVGHAALLGYFDGPVTVEEKVDGSQFSFGIFGGEIKVRSRGQQLVLDAPEKMFSRAVETVKEIAPKLKDGWTYRAEFLGTPKHNTLKYERTPELHLIVFDINPGHEMYLGYADKKAESERIGLECVDAFAVNEMVGLDDLQRFLDTESVLGGAKIEGVVCKRYDLYGTDKKVLLAKHVSEAFKEVHGKEWKKSNPTSGDFVGDLAARFKAEGRWLKAIQHLKERGELTGTPQDIAALIKEVQVDIWAEDRELIAQELVNFAKPRINRTAVHGLPEWYKNRLLESQFAEEPIHV